ncbi:MAG TPA: SWIM zinc finger family protein [Polyangiales bacterium]|nr:SWIM zinc finger family protein [Polyangiales bacterium]
MPLSLNKAQVLGLTSDGRTVAAGQKLARPAVWRGLGHSAAALWGECQGTTLYRTQVALADLAAHCSCPSRKSPCKHALGLLLLAADASERVSEASEPEWVKEWLERRAQRATRAATPDKPVDADAQAKRAQRRHDNILAGLDQLDVWLSDVVRQGLARLQHESYDFWDSQARRLVDAQAPGLAGRVRAMAERVGASDAWPQRILDDLGELALLSHAYRRIDQIEPLLAADVRRRMGMTLDSREVLARGDTLEDEWHVLCDVVDENERVRSQRAWLRGVSSKRNALVLQFTPLGTRFEAPLVAGTKLQAKLAFWPSAAPQRAMIVESSAAPLPLSAAPEGEDIQTALTRYAELLGRSPWVGASLIVLSGVLPLPAAGSDPYAVVDAAGLALPLRGSSHDTLLALSGGHPLTVAGEYDGYALSPRTAWAENRLVPLAPGGADE